MALQVWLPLNGDLHNQGLKDVTITNNGVTVDNNGKIGKCYKFGTGTSYLTLSNDAINTCTTECSLSLWINIISWNNSYATYFQAGLGGAAWNNYVFGLLRNASTSNLCFTISNGTTASSASYTTSNLELNTWYHIVCVYKTGHCLIYINGELYYDYTTTIIPAFSSITKTTVGVNNAGSYQTNCKLNDVRIYDHALSAKEVKEISKGLVCHYPLNNNGGGQPNLYNFESVANIWVIKGLTLEDATDDVYGNVLKITSPSPVSSERIYRGVSKVWKADTNFTVSFLAKASKTAVVKISRSTTDYAPDVTVGTTWKRYSTVIPCSATTTGGTLSIQTSTASADIYITQIKLEIGDKATAYCPGVGDSHYIPLGYDSTTEYDTSGYENNGTLNTSTSYSTNTPRYLISTYFELYNAPRLNVANSSIFPALTNCSLAWWEYCTHPDSTLMFSGQDTTRYIFAQISSMYSNNLYDRNIGSGNVILYKDGVQITTTKDGERFYHSTSHIEGEWHHFVLTGIDLSAWTEFYINGYNGSWAIRGYLSDFRIYATALSEEDIIELYQTSASIDKNGNMYSYEFVEEV